MLYYSNEITPFTVGDGVMSTVPPVKLINNELDPTLLSINSLNPFSPYISSPRGTMFSSSHISQALVISGATPQKCSTGTQIKFGHETFKIYVKEEIEIVDIIPKYRKNVSLGQEELDSESDQETQIWIYETTNDRTVGIIELVKFSNAVDAKHHHFGFRYKYNEAVINQVKPGSVLPPGLVLADSPNVEGFEPHSNYNFGIETNVAFMSVPGVIEDGVIISESYAKKITSKGYERRSASWGKKLYPLNLYGDETVYKPFPDIGECIREDGLLFVLREHDDLLAPIEMDPKNLRKNDYTLDKVVIHGVPGARVVDIQVDRNTDGKIEPTPKGMDTQTLQYYDKLVIFYQRILHNYVRLSQKRGAHFKYTPEFHRLVVEAMAYVGFNPDNPTVNKYKNNFLFKRRIQKFYKKVDIDNWRVEITFEYDVKPTIGHKLTGLSGDKGVICSVWPDRDMPVDEAGNRADAIMDGDSTIKRMNVGRVYKQWINACSRDVRKRLINQIQNTGDYQEAFQYLMSYYRTVSPMMADVIEDPQYGIDPKTHIDYVINNDLYLWTPTNNPASMVDVIRLTRDYFPPTLTPVTYGPHQVKTAEPVLIGSIYLIVLEKTGSDWSGTSSAKLQHFGLPSPIGNIDKYSSPGRQQPIKLLGETELRLINAVAGSDLSAELLDESNNPPTHKAVVKQLLRAEKPSNVDQIVDRDEHPYGNSRPQVFVSHILECCGIQWVRTVDDPIREKQILIKQQEQRTL